MPGLLLFFFFFLCAAEAVALLKKKISRVSFSYLILARTFRLIEFIKPFDSAAKISEP